MKQFYIPYNPTADIKYLYLLLLYKLADSSKVVSSGRSIYICDTIRYRTQHELVKRMNEEYSKVNPAFDKPIISASTLSRVLKDKKYKDYFIVNPIDKVIKLKNILVDNKNKEDKKKFVVLTEKAVDYLLCKNDNLLYNYYIYLLFSCGCSKEKSTDFTTKQFLEASGYSTLSNNYISKISSFNVLLAKDNFINIKKFRDNNGNERNLYTMKI